MSLSKRTRWIAFGAMLVVSLCTLFIALGAQNEGASSSPPMLGTVNNSTGYVVLTWNDLGMHCYNRNFSDLAVLPPYNTLWAQVVKVGDPPQIITTGVKLSYYFPSNTYSTGKSNFWDINPNSHTQTAQQLFGLTAPLTANIGLTGKGLAGSMDLPGSTSIDPTQDHFVAEGIPLTEYNDADWVNRYPFQLATIVVKDANTNAVLASNTVVAPVSTEMSCNKCHSDGQREGIATGVVEQNVLTLHDQEEGTNLMGSRPVLCASCHASNALGTTGSPDVPNLSNAMHNRHDGVLPDSIDFCYDCHPGPQTQCLRDVMSIKQGMTCISCHGGMEQVKVNSNPWLNEPRCDTCHNSGAYNLNKPLYRISTGHGGIRCEACHDSTHAIAQSSQPNDAIKFINLQGHAGTLDSCTVCHATTPSSPGPHGIFAPQMRTFLVSPSIQSSAPEPGATVIYTHTLQNTGNLSDTYAIAWSSSRGWGIVTSTLPIMLIPGDQAVMTVTVNVPLTETLSRGKMDATIITATSTISPTIYRTATDITLVPTSRVYLPLMMRN